MDAWDRAWKRREAAPRDCIECGEELKTEEEREAWRHSDACPVSVVDTAFRTYNPFKDE